MTAGTIVPASGGSVTAIGEPPAFFVPRGSGGIVVPLSILPGRDLPYAELQVFLETDPDVTCGFNIPDRPSWTQLKAADRLTLSVTGFQLRQLPCHITTIHAYLDTRNNPGLSAPPTPAETVLELRIPVNFTVR